MRCLAERSELRGWQNVAFHSRQFALLYSHMDPRLRATCGSTACRMAIASTHALAGWRRSIGRYGRAYLVHYPAKMANGRFRRLSTCLTTCRISGTSRACLRSRRPDGADDEYVQSLRAVHGESGILVIAPNYRGSTGYGKVFQQANLFDMGGGDLQDVLAAADWIQQTGYVDPKKLILMAAAMAGT